jgi:peptide/nickel transport system substrate-binding protein
LLKSATLAFLSGPGFFIYEETLMGERSGFANGIRLLMLLTAIFGLYMVIGGLDKIRYSVENLDNRVDGVVAELRTLNKTMKKGGLAVAVGNTSGGTTAGNPNGNPLEANSQYHDPAAEEGGEMVMTTSAETRNMNDIINNEAQVSDYWSMCNDSLAERDYVNPDKFVPKLAESWTISEDKLTFIIKLRKGCFWHDCTDPVTEEKHQDVPVTAHDFKFYLDVIRNEDIPCDPVRVYYKDLDRVEVVDDYTLKIVWKKKYFMSVSLTLGLSPLPKHFYVFDPKKATSGFVENHKRNSMIVGCGPWKLASWEKGKELVFRRNENYWGQKPAMNRLRFKVIKNTDARLIGLLKGEVDRLGLAPRQWSKLVSPEPGKDGKIDPTAKKDSENFKKNFHAFKYVGRSYSYIGWNMRRDIFKDKRVRQAMTHLVNRVRIRDEVLKGLATITTGNFWVKSSSYDSSVKPWPFDVARAKTLLAEAGWKDTDDDGVLDKDGRKFEFTIMQITTSDTQKRMLPIIKEDMAKAGVIMQIVPYEWSVYLERLEAFNFDACTLGWRLGYEGDPYQLWFSKEADKEKASNHCGFKNKRADEIILAAREEFDPGKRQKLYREFHRIMHEEQPYTFMFSTSSLLAESKRFRNAKLFEKSATVPIIIQWVPRQLQKNR